MEYVYYVYSFATMSITLPLIAGDVTAESCHLVDL
jgi:hypothetical protein